MSWHARYLAGCLVFVFVACAMSGSGPTAGAMSGAAEAVNRDSAAALPSCASLATDPTLGLAGKPTVIPGSATSVIVPASDPRPITNGISPATPSFCQVDFTFSSMGGPENGYDVGQKQMIKI